MCKGLCKPGNQPCLPSGPMLGKVATLLGHSPGDLATESLNLRFRRDLEVGVSSPFFTLFLPEHLWEPFSGVLEEGPSSLWV